MADNSKPDKPVPCPRCQSLNTKFCYFNNYNVKQPRHFCRECQRYWTAGGSLRNVPVGAGRRKNKSSFSCNGTKSTDTAVQTSSFAAAASSTVSSADLADQGLCISPVASGTILSFKQPSVGPSSAPAAQTFAGLQDPSHVDVSGRNFSGFAERGQNLDRNVSLELKLSKEKTDELVDHNATPASVNEELKGPSSAAKHDGMTTPIHIAERDESTCCSSVTATLACSSSEAVSQPATSTMMMPVLPFMTNASGFSNPASWGPLMWPWLWPFILSGTGSMLAPGAMPQVDPTSLAVAFSSMQQADPTLALRIGNLAGSSTVPQVDAVSMPQSNIAAPSGSNPYVDPALLAQLSALASGTMSQHIDPTISAAVTASFLQWQRAWNPYAWSLPWNLNWNAGTNTATNLTSMLNKRPQSPTQPEEQKSLHAPKILRTEPHEGGTVKDNATTYQPLVNGFQAKAGIQKTEEDSQVKGPSSVVFQERC